MSSTNGQKMFRKTFARVRHENVLNFSHKHKVNCKCCWLNSARWDYDPFASLLKHSNWNLYPDWTMTITTTLQSDVIKGKTYMPLLLRILCMVFLISWNSGRASGFSSQQNFINSLSSSTPEISFTTVGRNGGISNSVTLFIISKDNRTDNLC